MTYERLPNQPRSSSPAPAATDIISFAQFGDLAKLNHLSWYDSFFGVTPTRTEGATISILSAGAVRTRLR